MAYTATLSGGGEVDLSGVADVAEYVVAHVITAGPLVRTPFDQAADLVTKVGWIRWGALIDLGYGSQGYWHDPLWINGLRWIWALPVGQHRSTPRMQYWFSPGTSVYVLIGP